MKVKQNLLHKSVWTMFHLELYEKYLKNGMFESVYKSEAKSSS